MITFADALAAISLSHVPLQPQEVEKASLIVAAIGLPDEQLKPILADVQGKACGLDELGSSPSGGAGQDAGVREKLKKMYKLTEEELAMASLEDCVIMRMAVKDH